MQVRVTYLFGLRDRERDSVRTLDVPAGTTVFQIMQELGLSGLELHPAVNGRSVPDATVLEDGDELILIPGIQGGG